MSFYKGVLTGNGPSVELLTCIEAYGTVSWSPVHCREPPET